MFKDKRLLRLFKITVLVILLLVVVGYDSFYASVLNKVDLYAVLVCAADDGNPKKHSNLDPIDLNVDITALSKIYATLTDCGYKDENIFILYCTKSLEPDWSEKVNQKYIQQIKKKHFSGKYTNDATKKNINSIIDSLKGKIDDNDQFIFYLLAHGQQTGVVQLAGGPWSSQEIQTTLGGFKSKTNIFCFDSCFSGVILKRTNFDNAVFFVTTSDKTPGWDDRNFSNSANFLANKADKKNDTNKDGIVDCDEAFKATEKAARDYEPKWKEYIRTKYKPAKPVPRGVMESASIIPEIKVGKDYVEANLGSGSSSGGSTVCDMKKVEKIPICTACGKTLLGYKCLGCKKMFALDEGADKKCPDCGSAKLSPTKLVVENKCFFCKGPIKEEEQCVKSVYYCPDHPDDLFLSAGSCPKCKKKLELKETVTSKITTFYECPKCGATQESPGKCPNCKTSLSRKQKCEKSGTFPHVDEQEWAKQHK